MTRTAGAPIGCQRPNRFWGLGCPKIYHEVEDTLDLGIGKDLHPEMDPMGWTGTGRRLLSVNSSRFCHFRILCDVTLYCLARATCLRSR
ncbi:hypothetical protein [Thiolapillus sp.]|uniref:hypothetical protein n=2 Tax=Thiolapillus sp. TaxID=2017437 RepID=UPI0025E2AF8D|nr:hypothetical protein [Thiolapillus sp.]